jgi:hypothetical protein
MGLAEGITLGEEAEAMVLGPAERDGRLDGRDARRRMGTSGVFPGMSSDDWTDFWRACAVLACFILAVDTVDVSTIVHDAAQRGQPMPLWRPAVWEYTSGVSYLAFVGLAYGAVRLAPPRAGGWWRVIVVHVAASFCFSLLHVLGMFGLRMAIYAALGGRYSVNLMDFPYEYRKDILSYMVGAVVFWGFRTLRSMQAAAQPVESSSAPETFDIIEGSRIVRTPVRSIVAATSAGNYVEFLLDDGRRILMRITLAKVEATLAPQGFVRTHRSWIVNPERLRSLEPLGSGDFRITLEGSAEAPLSRRFSAALEQLRAAA